MEIYRCSSSNININILLQVFGASNAQYILEVEILTYYNNWDIRFPCTGRNACGAQYAYCLREFGSKSANFLSEKELCLDGHRDSPLGVVPEENATNITLNVREVFVVNSSLPVSSNLLLHPATREGTT